MTQRNRDPITFLPLHPLEFRILLVLMDGPSHGYRIVKEVEARERELAGIYPANLYRRIRDLLSKGLLEEVDAPEGVETDPRRRYFSPTPLGVGVVKAEARRLENLVGEARTVGAISGR